MGSNNSTLGLIPAFLGAAGATVATGVALSLNDLAKPGKWQYVPTEIEKKIAEGKPASEKALKIEHKGINILITVLLATIFFGFFGAYIGGIIALAVKKQPEKKPREAKNE